MILWLSYMFSVNICSFFAEAACFSYIFFFASLANDNINYVTAFTVKAVTVKAVIYLFMDMYIYYICFVFLISLLYFLSFIFFQFSCSYVSAYLFFLTFFFFSSINWFQFPFIFDDIVAVFLSITIVFIIIIIFLLFCLNKCQF